MERIRVLINKLNEQFQNKADPAQMLFTIQLLQSELSHFEANGNKVLGTSKVAVLMPKTMSITPFPQEKTSSEPPLINPKEPEVSANGYYPVKQVEQNDFGYDPLVEIPTLSHQPSIKELNEAIAIRHESVNDKLKQDQTELFEKLKESPVRDLRKAIGINDRFVFINELFRGDEAMYERSIKTINNFHLFAEAEYWIIRELKVKIGWNENDEVVKHFYFLVKRRFS